jgi:hypothetical protein
LDEQFPKHPSVFHAGRPSTQTLDIATSIYLILEKAQDCKDKGAIGECDIRAFYDNVLLLLRAMAGTSRLPQRSHWTNTEAPAYSTGFAKDWKYKFSDQ